MKESCEWVFTFVDLYNNKHYHSGLNFVTPNSRHTCNAGEIMEHHKQVYKAARELHPHRFNKGIRKWKLPNVVALNPTDEIKLNLKST